MMKGSKGIREFRILCVSIYLQLRPQAYNFTKKEALTQLFSCEFCEIFKSNFVTEYSVKTASGRYKTSMMEIYFDLPMMLDKIKQLTMIRIFHRILNTPVHATLVWTYSTPKYPNLLPLYLIAGKFISYAPLGNPVHDNDYKNNME